MQSRQVNLANHASGFIAELNALSLDYQIGVISMDFEDAGELQSAVITPSTPNPGSQLQSDLILGEAGGNVEQGLDMAYLALSSPNTDPLGPNDGFLRPDAELRIIFLSDEVDQSHVLASTFDYLTFFQGLKADPDHVIISDITGGLSGCVDSMGLTAEAGSGYIELSIATGGPSLSICATDWGLTASTLGQASNAWEDTFTLSNDAIEETLEVFIDQVPVYVGWQHEPAINAIVFDEDHIPDAGDDIEVSYSGLAVVCP